MSIVEWALVGVIVLMQALRFVEYALWQCERRDYLDRVQSKSLLEYKAAAEPKKPVSAERPEKKFEQV